MIINLIEDYFILTFILIQTLTNVLKKPPDASKSVITQLDHLNACVFRDFP